MIKNAFIIMEKRDQGLVLNAVNPYLMRKEMLNIILLERTRYISHFLKMVSHTFLLMNKMGNPSINTMFQILH